MTEQSLRSTSPTPLELAAKAFYLDRQASNCTPRTLIWYRKYISEFTKWANSRGITTPEEVTPTDLRVYLVSCHERGLGPKSVHNCAKAVKTFLNFLVLDKLLAASPMVSVRMPKLPKNVLPPFSAEDAKRLIAACEDDRDLAIVLFLLDTGARAAEMVALDVGDVAVEDGSVLIKCGKGQKGRIVYIGARTQKVLIRCMIKRRGCADTEPLWVSKNDGNRLTVWGLRLLLKRLGDRAKVAHCHPHTFRRTFALWSLRAGMNIYALQKLMGHADLQILAEYLALVEGDMEFEHREHGAVDAYLGR